MNTHTINPEQILEIHTDYLNMLFYVKTISRPFDIIIDIIGIIISFIPDSTQTYDKFLLRSQQSREEITLRITLINTSDYNVVITTICENKEIIYNGFIGALISATNIFTNKDIIIF